MMVRRVITYIIFPVLIAGIVLGLLGVGLRSFDGAQDGLRSGQAQAAMGNMAQTAMGNMAQMAMGNMAQMAMGNMAQMAMGNIDPTDKWTWSTNAGWVNFCPTHGGVRVYSDHLEGYAWAENIGWIRLGSYTGGGTHTYGNTTNTDYGVNNDGSGNLSGFAWATNVGWINFNPPHSQVTIDPATGSFDGYAWAENVGWFHFKNTGPAAYNVVVNFDGGGSNIYLPFILKGSAPGSAAQG